MVSNGAKVELMLPGRKLKPSGAEMFLFCLQQTCHCGPIVLTLQTLQAEHLKVSTIALWGQAYTSKIKLLVKVFIFFISGKQQKVL